MPQDFNVNIAESQMSIDFDISHDSRAGATFVSQFSQHASQAAQQQQPRKSGFSDLKKKSVTGNGGDGEGGESQDYMDSGDFQVS